MIALNSNAGGNEHPITEQFIADYSRDVFPVTVVKAMGVDLGGIGSRSDATRDRRELACADDEELTFDSLALIKGRFPSRKMQFCTDFLKKAPQLRWCRENLTDKGIAYKRYAGLRCDESQTRQDTPDSIQDDYFGCVVNFPIRCWSKLEVFAFLKHHGEEPNPLYTMGFSRVGSAPCVNSGKDDVRLWAARFPEMIDKVREWERRVGRTFFAPCVPGKAINWVDEVVAWSKTARGGKQNLLPIVEIEAASGECSSKYGLCE